MDPQSTGPAAAKEIRQWCADKGVTVAALAHAAGMTASALHARLWQWGHGLCEPTVSTRRRLLAAQSDLAKQNRKRWSKP